MFYTEICVPRRGLASFQPWNGDTVDR